MFFYVSGNETMFSVIHHERKLLRLQRLFSIRICLRIVVIIIAKTRVALVAIDYPNLW